jgi:hypothetical protein
MNRTTHVDAKTGARVGYDTQLNVLIADTADKIHGYQYSPDTFATATVRPGGPLRYVLP